MGLSTTVPAGGGLGSSPGLVPGRSHGLGWSQLNLSLRDPRISSTVVGTAAPAHVDELAELVPFGIRDALWAELSQPVPPPTEWLD